MRTLKAIAWALALAVPAGAGAATESTRPGDYDRGVQIEAVGGVRGFVTSGANDILDPGGAWGVVASFQAIPVLDFEIGYQGASYMTDPDLPGAQTRVNQNGGQALLKASPKAGSIEPYAFGGVDVSMLNPAGSDQTFIREDTVFALPVGLGVDFHVPVSDGTNLLIGARGTYAFGFGDDQAFLGVNDNNDWVQVALQAGAHF